MADWILIVLGLCACVAGVFALRLAWRLRAGDPATRRIWLAGSWGGVLAATILLSSAYGAERGVALALVILALAALVVVALNLTRRPDRAQRDGVALAPSRRGARIWRGAFRFLLAGPISGVAAIGIALAFTLKAPLGEVDKLILGGSLVPILWGAGMAWTLADDRILRAAAALLGVGAAGFAIGMI